MKNNSNKQSQELEKVQQRENLMKVTHLEKLKINQEDERIDSDRILKILLEELRVLVLLLT